MDIKTKSFIDNAKDLVIELESFKNTLFKSFPGYSDSIFDLNNSLDFIKIQYDDSNNDEQSNREIVAKFAERYFKALTKLLTIIKGINQGNDEITKERINEEFHDTAIKIVKLIGEYGFLLKYYSDDMAKNVNIATKEFNKVRETIKRKSSIKEEKKVEPIDNNDFSSYILQSIPDKETSNPYANNQNLISSDNVSSKPSTNMLNYNNISSPSSSNKTDYSNDFANLFGESLNLINEWLGLEDSSRDIEYTKALELYERTKDWDRIWNGNFSTTTKYAMYFNTAIDNVGVFLSSGIDSLGNLFGRLFVKIADGAEHTAECFDVINKKGFDGFLNDDKCMGNKTVTKI